MPQDVKAVEVVCKGAGETADRALGGLLDFWAMQAERTIPAPVSSLITGLVRSGSLAALAFAVGSDRCDGTGAALSH
ncbi:MAG TPA: hypothetical protein VKR06_35535, partial [Ktedonosporobacter sp.]|nr:hypothetical protein [Ktedonosporobacter sp.]